MSPLPRWIGPLLLLTALGLGPWTLYLTYSLPSRHLTRHYDLAWIGFDIALLAAFATTGWCVLRTSRWLVPAAAVTGTMLLCDAWFDTITASSGSEQVESILEACLAELPLAALCAYVVWDAERITHSLQGRRR
ncbi:MAG TPA: hypothetical protein VGK79_15535 [Gaiellaceae bacterium]